MGYVLEDSMRAKFLELDLNPDDLEFKEFFLNIHNMDLTVEQLRLVEAQRKIIEDQRILLGVEGDQAPAKEIGTTRGRIAKTIRKYIFYGYIGCIAPSIALQQSIGRNPWPRINLIYYLYVEQGGKK